jgi:hypothetical protein
MYPTPSLFREPSRFEDCFVGQLVKHIVGMGNRDGLIERTNVDWERRCSRHRPHNPARVPGGNSHSEHTVWSSLGSSGGECGEGRRGDVESGGAKCWARRGEGEELCVWLVVDGGWWCALNWHAPGEL